MTSGGTVVRVLPASGGGVCALPRRRWFDDPRLVEHLPLAFAVTVFAGVFLRIRQRWFLPGFSGFGYTEWVVQSTVDGVAIAPNQYRPLMPWVMSLVGRVAGIPLPTAILAVDALLLVAVIALLHLLACRLGSPWLVMAGAAGWAWFAVKIDHWHPEITLLTVIVLATTLQLASARPRAAVLLALGLLACGARTDYAAGLGVVVLAVGLARRRYLLATSGAAVGVAAVAVTAVLADWVYPQAYYRVDLVQLPANLSATSLFFVATFYGPLLAVPALLALRRRAMPPLAFVMAWFLVELAAIFVVGRTEESRLFMPLVPALAVVTAVSWRELCRDIVGDGRSPGDAPGCRSGGRAAHRVAGTRSITPGRAASAAAPR